VCWYGVGIVHWSDSSKTAGAQAGFVLNGLRRWGVFGLGGVYMLTEHKPISVRMQVDSHMALLS